MLIARTPDAAKQHAQRQLALYSWNNKQWECLTTLWQKESNWRPQAQNKQFVWITKNGKRIKVQAGGIPQILGMSPELPVENQVAQGLKYIQARYGSPCSALKFHLERNYY